MARSNMTLAEKLREMEQQYNKPSGYYYQQLSQPSAWQDQAAYNRFLADAKKTGYEVAAPKVTVTPRPTAIANQVVSNLTNRAGSYTAGYQPYQPNRQIDQLLNTLIRQAERSRAPSIQDIMGSDYYQSLQSAIEQQTQEAQKQAMARLAAAGVLGEGSTPAAQKISEVWQQHDQRMGALVPQLAQIVQAQQQANFNNLIQALSQAAAIDQQNWGRDMSYTQTMLPYLYEPAGAAADRDLRYIEAMGQTPSGSPGVVELRQWAEQRGYTVGWDENTGNVIINGVQFSPEVLRQHGARLVNGRWQVPLSVVEWLLGGVR